MFAIISSPEHINSIIKVIELLDEQILYKKIDREVDILEEVERIKMINVKYFIIDITALDEDVLIQAIRSYRIARDNTQIIIIAPNCLPGNPLLSDIVHMGVYNIITPNETDEIVSMLLEVIENPMKYKQVVKYSLESETTIHSKVKIEKEIEERTVRIYQDKILGTVTIGLAGTINRIGTTHLALTFAKFLKEQKFNVAIMEFHKSNNFNLIKNAYEDIKIEEDSFILDGIHFYPYKETLDILDVLDREYNYIIIDFGIYDKCNKKEFFRCTLRNIISGTKDWELLGLENILRSNETINKNNYIFNFAETKIFKEIRDNMDKLKCFMAPYNPDPFKISKENKERYKEILEEVLPDINKISKDKKIFYLKNMINNLIKRRENVET